MTGVPPRVKICGITRIEDALHATACGADALGFVFYERSPRCVTPETAREIIAALPPFVSVTGLFVNESRQRIEQISVFCGLDVVQLHGDESPADCLLAPLRVIKALRVRGPESLAGMGSFSVSALLLDAWSPDSYGGTGHTFNWELARSAAEQYPVILAGGLESHNVAEAIRQVHPYGVDVSSGVESAPGIKDPELVASFIRQAKTATE